MTPQELSIADLKAVIDYTRGSYDPKVESIYFACAKELKLRVMQIHPPTEPKNEEK